MPSDLIYREDAKDYARHALAKGLDVLEYLDEVPATIFRPAVQGGNTIIIRNMDTPKNCRLCPFKELKIINDGNARYVMYKCLAAEGVWITYTDLGIGRHPDCPIET